MGGKEAVAKEKTQKKKVEILGLVEEESREASCWKQENRAKLDEITKGGGVRERGGDIHTKVDRRKFVLGLFWKGGKKKSNQNHPRKTYNMMNFPRQRRRRRKTVQLMLTSTRVSLSCCC